VLVYGETGTGKELVARALHDLSPRARCPFVAVNVATLRRELTASELFGHERGAFTGAQAARQGRFEQAEGGTLFLDEIGDMPAELQTRLLRVLSDGHFYRVGGMQPIRSNVRVIAATHQDLDQRAREGLFREDLYHRLNVIRLRLPALRERAQDIPLLARHFLQHSARELKVEAKRLSETALRFLSSQPFPGNVRQLENLCHWLTVMAPGQTVEIADLPPDVRSASSTPTDGDWLTLLDQHADEALLRGERGIIERLTRDFERTLILRALQHTGGRRIEAAQLLGLGRNTLTRKIQDMGLDDGAAEDCPGN
jgi:two-component system nitrogen regulation response regulator GlnG